VAAHHSTGSAATIDTRRAETQSGSAAPRAQESVARKYATTVQIIRQIALIGCRRSEMIGLMRTEEADREIDDFMTVPRSRPG